MSREHHLQVSIKASFSTLNELTDQTKRIWLVFHGYGQLSRYFVQKFKGLDPVENFIIAPQGLSKFYLEGFSGRVGATWMTREDRLTEIVNQQAYVDQVLSSIDIDWASVQLNYFGFSQGVATMVRYAAYAQIPFAQMVVWAGTFPPEPMSDAFAFLSGQESISYFSGKDDPFYKPEMEEQQRETIYKASGITPKVVFFEGKHEVKSELVSQL